MLSLVDIFHLTSGIKRVCERNSKSYNLFYRDKIKVQFVLFLFYFYFFRSAEKVSTRVSRTDLCSKCNKVRKIGM